MSPRRVASPNRPPNGTVNEEGSMAIYKDRSGPPRTQTMTEGKANFSEMTRQALLSVEEAKARAALENA